MKISSVFLIAALLLLSSCYSANSAPTQESRDTNGPEQDFNPDNSISRNLKEGDIIFQKSQSAQSAAIREATGSEWSHVGILIKDKNVWYVAEAIQPLQATELQKWIKRGKNSEYKVMRNPELRDSHIPAMYSILSKYQGQNYDIYFEWNDDLIYCSELVYKVFQQLTGNGVGKVQKMKELNLDGPYVKELIKKRLTDLGKTLNPEEEIVTPVAQLLDKKLIEVKSRKWLK